MKVNTEWWVVLGLDVELPEKSCEVCLKMIESQIPTVSGTNGCGVLSCRWINEGTGEDISDSDATVFGNRNSFLPVRDPRLHFLIPTLTTTTTVCVPQASTSNNNRRHQQKLTEKRLNFFTSRCESTSQRHNSTESYSSTPQLESTSNWGF